MFNDKETKPHNVQPLYNRVHSSFRCSIPRVTLSRPLLNSPLAAWCLLTFVSLDLGHYRKAKLKFGFYLQMKQKQRKWGQDLSVLSYKTNYVLVWCIYLFFHFYNNLCWFIYLSGLTILQQNYLTDLHTVFCKIISAHLRCKSLENFYFFSKVGGVGYYLFYLSPSPFFI